MENNKEPKDRFKRTYDSRGNLTWIRDNRGFFVEYSYDEDNNLVGTRRSSYNLPINFVYEPEDKNKHS